VFFFAREVVAVYGRKHTICPGADCPSIIGSIVHNFISDSDKYMPVQAKITGVVI